MPLAGSFEEILGFHETRNFGASGFREVTLTVLSNSAQAFTYRISHVWKAADGVCSSLYYLTEPSVLEGTTVLMVERPRISAMDIWLRLRTARGAIRIDPSRHDQFVLGTDFTYEDLRFWLPTDTFAVDRFALSSDTGHPHCTIWAEQMTRSGTRSKVMVILHGTEWLPLTIEWREEPSNIPRRIYSATDLIAIDGTWTPRLISIHRPRERYQSVMSLTKARCGIAIDDSTLQMENMTRLSRPLFDSLANGAQRIAE